MQKQSIKSTILDGTIAGIIATIPMTAALLVIRRLLPPQEQYALPPTEITRQVAKKTGLDKEVTKSPQITLATGATHLGYGALSGGIFSALASYLPGPMIAKGVIFALLLWTGSYLGWIPALGILAPATEHPRGRVAMMIFGHLIFGSVTALITDRLEGE